MCAKRYTDAYLTIIKANYTYFMIYRNNKKIKKTLIIKEIIRKDISIYVVFV